MVARRGAMDQLEPLAAAEEQHAVLARVVSPAQGLHPDRRGGPRTGLTLARSDEAPVARAATFCDRLGDAQRRPARRVELGGVVELEHLGVVAVTEETRGLARQVEEHVHGD